MALLANRAFYAEIRDQTPFPHDPPDRYRRGILRGINGEFGGKGDLRIPGSDLPVFSRENFIFFGLLENLLRIS